MALTIRPAEPDRLPNFAGVVDGIDLREPLTAETAAAITAGMDRFAVLIFHGQQIDDEQQLAFSRNFGTLEIANADIRRPEDRRLKAEVADISNLNRNNEIMSRDDRRRLFSLGNMLWHSDSSFKPTPAKYSLLHARILPKKDGNTEFADMRAAYDALDDATKAEIDGLITEHSIVFSREQIGFTDYATEHTDKLRPVPHRLVEMHPVTGRKSLYLSSHIGGIVGWPVPEARAFIRDLTEHATQPQFVYSHAWRVNDLVMWDNRTVMHRARRFRDLEEVRDLRRTSIKGTGLAVEPVSAVAAE